MLGIIGFSLLSDISPVVTCEQWKYNTGSTSENYYAHPVKTVVKPWRGQHHVYGNFIIPKGYRSYGFFTLTLPGKKTYCGTLRKIKNISPPGLDIQPKTSLIRGYLNTRTALWLIIQGHLNDLKNPQNWKLIYFEKRKYRF
jgi:hypothetical protein